MKIKKFNELNENLRHSECQDYLDDMIDKTFEDGGNGENLRELGSAAALIDSYDARIKGYPGEGGFYEQKTIDAFKRLVDSIYEDEITNNHVSKSDDFDDFVKNIEDIDKK